MNRRSVILLVLLALGSIGFFVWKKDQHYSVIRNNNARPPHTSSTSSSSSSTRPAHSATCRSTEEAPFWESAIVPDPGEHVPPLTIRPEDLGIIVPAVPTPPAEVIAKAISENNYTLIQSATLAWFQQDPTAARDWLASQPDLATLQPAISAIAQHISETSAPMNAIEWANILTDPVAREDTLFQIQARALLNRRINSSQIITDGLSPERIEELRSGGAGH